ncbi:MAG TPA: alpha/beta fold hydrolase [Chitinophagales bacterium]|nr:alpha/beta fold hydrolase [Chitinophagales bacterium]HNF18273.1 alpha/beta fold hydrolase [Chitinophagales bacterium]HNL56641.1 alpha/beta fold hydrolase [Chitinophagales bacterium]
MLYNSPILKSPKWLYTKHLQTIIPNVYRKVEGVFYQRERIETWDDDFLDLDWSKVNSNKIIIISHGFEGSSDRVYARGLTKILNANGFDVCVWNFRGCSGEDNRQFFGYHSGKTDDLDYVVKHILTTKNYDEHYMIGISMGGNLTMKYLGEDKWETAKKIVSALTVSVPIHYETSFEHLCKGWNLIYERRFTKQVKDKVLKKITKYPDAIDYKHVLEAKNLWEFTARCTVPMHGFTDIHDYNKKVQASTYIRNIQTPTLLINADNDPLLTKECYPTQVAKKSNFFHLEITIGGGHVGFCEDIKAEHNWLENRVVTYFTKGY